MSIKQDGTGRRWVEIETEVPGTPEEVWQAVATGPGISSWFVPTEFEAGEDSTPVSVISHFAPGASMDATASIVEWNPPRSFSAEARELGADAPPVATEWIVAARSGGSCVVRVVHSLFTSSDDWDDQLEMWESGWPGFFRLLRLYLTHFSNLQCAPLQFMGISTASKQDAWKELIHSLGFENADVGEFLESRADAPTLMGFVEHMGEGDDAEEILLRLDRPAPGFAHMFALPMDGRVYMTVRLSLFGDNLGDLVTRENAKWHAWMAAHFSSVEKEASP